MAILKKVKTVAAKAATATVQSKPVEMGKLAPTESKAVAIPQVKAGALSLDLGPMIAKAIAKFTEGDKALQKARLEQNERDYTMISAITAAGVKATRADPSIDFALILGKDDAKKKEVFAKMYIATGLKKVVRRGKPGQEVEQLDWNPDTEVGQILGESEKDAKDVKELKDSYRTNLSKKLRQAMLSALWLVETKGVNFKQDKDSGTLLLSGPGVQSIYGAPAVLLNQAVNQPNRDADGADMGSKTTLKAKPSFTDIAKRAQEAHGKVLMSLGSGRVKQFDDQHAHVVHICDMMVKVLEKYSDPNPAAQAALESALNAIEETLG